MSSNNVSFHNAFDLMGNSDKGKSTLSIVTSLGAMNCPAKGALFGEMSVKGMQSTSAARERAGKQSVCHASCKVWMVPPNMQGTFLGNHGLLLRQKRYSREAW